MKVTNKPQEETTQSVVQTHMTFTRSATSTIEEGSIDDDSLSDSGTSPSVMGSVGVARSMTPSVANSQTIATSDTEPPLPNGNH